MIFKPSEFFKILKKNGIDFFCGVPDSLLKNFTNYIDSKVSPSNHIITANEGNAVALATGYNLGTKKIGLVYLQNSGLGNCINPLTSLTNEEVYSIPLVLLIGWRGFEGKNDEPQHLKQGKILKQQLKILGIKFIILEKKKGFEKSISDLILYARTNSIPVAILVKKNSFSDFNLKQNTSKFLVTKRQVIENVIPHLSKKDLVFSTTGMISRSIIECLKKHKKNSKNFFFNVGSMGHVSSIALGVAITNKKRIICIDGDGSFLMHLGALAIIGSKQLGNFKYILINNGCHESVGGQKTVAFDLNIKNIAEAFGFKYFGISKKVIDLQTNLKKTLLSKSPCFLEVKVKIEDEKNLPRPSKSLIEYKKDFLKII